MAPAAAAEAAAGGFPPEQLGSGCGECPAGDWDDSAAGPAGP